MATGSLTEKFQHAFDRLKRTPTEGPMESGGLRFKLYGLSKQAIEGDCNAPIPPKTNTILRTKWEAWSSFRGTSREQAMREFLDLMEKFETGKSSRHISGPLPVASPNSNVIASSVGDTALSLPRTNSNQSDGSSNNNSTSGVGFTQLSAGVSKVGILYKQRDVFKGWRPRKFILVENMLHYFLEPDDPIPRKSMDLSGCSISTVRSARIGEVEYFPFVISHPKSAKSYNLSSDSRSEMEDWVSRLRAAAARNETMTNFIDRPEQRLLKTQSQPAEPILRSSEPLSPSVKGGSGSAAATESSTNPSTEEEKGDLVGVPPELKEKLEKAVSALLAAVQPGAPNWEPLFEKQGVTALKRAGDVICVRGDGRMPFSIPDILSLLTNNDRMKEYNSQLNSCRMLKCFNNQTGVHHLRFKQVWPTAARDMVTLYHWRLLPDGRLVMLSFSEPSFDSLGPPDSGTVRAELILGGYVMTPLSLSETAVTYVVQSDLKGSLPTSVVNLVSSTQPMIVFAIKKTMTEQFAKQPAVWAGKKFTREDLIDISAANRGEAPIQRQQAPTPAHSSTPAPSSSIQSHAPASDEVQVSSQPTSVAAEREVPSSPRSPASHSYQHTQVTLGALLPLLIPSLLYRFCSFNSNRPAWAQNIIPAWIVPPQWIMGWLVRYRAAVFVVLALLCVRRAFKSHIGPPRRHIEASASNTASLPHGRTLVRFPVDLNKLIRYLEAKRSESGVEVTMTHIAAKAAAVAINDFKGMKGRLVLGQFYPCSSVGVDIGVSADVSESETVVLKCEDSDAKPVEYIADELIRATRSLQADRKAGSQSPKERALRWLPPFVAVEIDGMLSFLGSQLGLSLPLFGIAPFPLGQCVVITSPNGTGDADIDVAAIPQGDGAGSSAPITLTIGGIRVLASIDADRKLHASHALNVCVTVDSRAASLIETRKFCSRLQSYMNNPFLLDKDDRLQLIGKEDSGSSTSKQNGHTPSATVVTSATQQQLESVNKKRVTIARN